VEELVIGRFAVEGKTILLLDKDKMPKALDKASKEVDKNSKEVF
jgi:hypothetical protein